MSIYLVKSSSQKKTHLLHPVGTGDSPEAREEKKQKQKSQTMCKLLKHSRPLEMRPLKAAVSDQKVCHVKSSTKCHKRG